jgi:hypothetical protein
MKTAKPKEALPLLADLRLFNDISPSDLSSTATHSSLPYNEGTVLKRINNTRVNGTNDENELGPDNLPTQRCSIS